MKIVIYLKSDGDKKIQLFFERESGQWRVTSENGSCNILASSIEDGLTQALSVWQL